jgi:hypothetical protein
MAFLRENVYGAGASGQYLRLCKSGGFDVRRPGTARIKPRDPGALRDQREHGIEARVGMPVSRPIS